MADQIIGDAAVKRQALIAALVQKELIASSKLAATVMNVSQFAVPGSKSIEFPYANSFSVTKKVSGTAVDAAALTYAGDTLNLDQHAVIQWLIEDKASLQSIVNVEVDAIARATRAHAKGVDVDVYTQLIAGADNAAQSVSFTGNTNTTMGRADIINALKILELQEVDVENGEVYLAINPTQKSEILNISDFIDASKFGSNVPIQKGVIGEVLGAKVIVTTSVTADAAVMYHKEALALGFQQMPRFKQQSDLANVAERYSLDQLYGLKYMQEGIMSVKLYQA